MSPRRLRDHAALVAASGDDPFVRWDVDPRPPLDAWSDPATGAVAFARSSHRWGRSLVAVGPPDAAAALAGHLLEVTGLPAATVTRPGGEGDDGGRDESRTGRIDRRDGGEPGAAPTWCSPLSGLTRLDDWDWMWAAAAPGDRLVRGWAGVRGYDPRRLIACAAWEERVPGVPHLASIATDPRQRGRGLGTVVTAALTRRLLRGGSPVVTLALYAENHAARRVYDRLGFRLAQRLVTWTRSEDPNGPSSARRCL